MSLKAAGHYRHPPEPTRWPMAPHGPEAGLPSSGGGLFSGEGRGEREHSADETPRGPGS